MYQVRCLPKSRTTYITTWLTAVSKSYKITLAASKSSTWCSALHFRPAGESYLDYCFLVDSSTVVISKSGHLHLRISTPWIPTCGDTCKIYHIRTNWKHEIHCSVPHWILQTVTELILTHRRAKMCVVAESGHFQQPLEAEQRKSCVTSCLHFLLFHNPKMITL